MANDEVAHLSGARREGARAENEIGADSFTPREADMIRLLAQGLTGPEIADQLLVSHDTVRTHVRNAMVKVGARTRAQLVAVAVRQGLG